MIKNPGCMANELAEGFDVQDVYEQRCIGYDVLPTHSDGRRREIEVKARCDMSGVQFTEMEREHLKNSEHAVVHIIGNAGRPDQHRHPAVPYLHAPFQHRALPEVEHPD